MTKDRPQASIKDINNSMQDVGDMLMKRLSQRGWGIFVSQHECLGIIQEEFNEYSVAVQANNKALQREELIDIAVGCIFAITSIDSGKMDW
jgi:hypothetical protein